MIWKLCDTYGSAPFSGGVLEQPLGLLVMGMAMGNYMRAYEIYESDPSHAPPEVRTLVLLTALAAANEDRSERG